MQQLKILFLSLLFTTPTLLLAQNVGIQFDASTQSFPGLEYSALDFGDIDGDGDQDFIITGSNGNSTNNAATYLYENQGNGFFVLVSGTPFERVFEGDVEFADIDNDGDLDLLIAGENNSGDDIVEMYTNDGAGNYTLKPSSFTFICPTGNGAHPNFKFVELNNDQYLDLVYLSSVCSEVMFNDGTGHFTGSTSIAQSSSGTILDSDIAVGDLDNDGDNDIGLLAKTVGDHLTKLYRNINLGQFQEINNVGITESYGTGNIDFVDTDNDNDLDILINGPGYVTAIHYKNNESTFGNWEFDSINMFDNLQYGKTIFFDVNLDGYTDMLRVGANSNYETKFFMNHEWNNSYYDYSDYTYVIDNYQYVYSDVDYADIDGDDDYDLLISGRFGDGSTQTPKTTIYINNSCPESFTEVRRQTVCDTLTWRGRFFEEGIIYNQEYYLDTMFSSNGCDSILRLYPEWLSITGPDLYINDTYFEPRWYDIAENAISVQWLDCSNNNMPIPGADSLAYVPDENGIYRIVIDNGVCVDTSLCFIVQDIVATTAEYKRDNAKIYPNPSSGIFNIETPYSSFLYQVYNTVGQEVLSGQVNQSYLQLDLASFESGVYILNMVRESGERVSYRLVRE